MYGSAAKGDNVALFIGRKRGDAIVLMAELVSALTRYFSSKSFTSLKLGVVECPVGVSEYTYGKLSYKFTCLITGRKIAACKFEFRLHIYIEVYLATAQIGKFIIA